MQTARFWIDHLKLTAHPEGGYFSEIYRNVQEISDSELTQKYSGKRNMATSIYFLLEHGKVSKLHRLKSDEIWYFHYGSPLLVHVFHNNRYTCYRMGTNPANNEVFQVIIPAGAIFGAEVVEPDSFTIVGCVVTPGFHFDDFELVTKDAVSEFASSHQNLISKLT